MNGTMRTESGELDLELCDGYSELETDTLKEMVKVALERGYVDDADWRGPPGNNRPNTKGEEDEAETAPGEPAPPKKRGRKPKPVNPDEKSQTLSRKKAGRPKKAAITPEDVDNKEEAVPNIKKDFVANGKEPQEEDAPHELEMEPEESSSKRVSGRNRGAKVTYGDEYESEELGAYDEDEVKKKATGVKRGRKPKVKPDDENQEEGVSIPAKPKRKRGRPPKAKPVNAEGEEVAPAEPKLKGKRGRKPKAQAEKEAPAAQNAGDEIVNNPADDDTSAKGDTEATTKKDEKEKKIIVSDTDNVVTDPVESNDAASGVKRKITQENESDEPIREKESAAVQPTKKRGRHVKKAKADDK